MAKVSLREYAKIRGCTEGAVRAAIRTGKIKNGVIKNDEGINKFIDTDIADVEWSKNYREDRKGSSNYELHSNLDKAAKGKPKTEARPKQKTDTGEPDGEAGDVTMSEAKRREAIAKAKILEIELAEKENSLISTETVRRAMYEFGEEVKSALLSVPDRATDDVLAAQTRNEAYLILKTAIMDALGKLATSKIKTNEWATEQGAN